MNTADLSPNREILHILLLLLGFATFDTVYQINIVCYKFCRDETTIRLL